jgi:hypothetical protein
MEEEDLGQWNLFWSYFFYYYYFKVTRAKKITNEKIIKKIASNPIIILK